MLYFLFLKFHEPKLKNSDSNAKQSANNTFLIATFLYLLRQIHIFLGNKKEYYSDISESHSPPPFS